MKNSKVGKGLGGSQPNYMQGSAPGPGVKNGKTGAGKSGPAMGGAIPNYLSGDKSTVSSVATRTGQNVSASYGVPKAAQPTSVSGDAGQKAGSGIKR